MKRLALLTAVLAAGLVAAAARAEVPPPLTVPVGYSVHAVAVDGDIYHFGPGLSALSLGFDAVGNLLVGTLDPPNSCFGVGGGLFSVASNGVSNALVAPGVGLNAPDEFALGPGGPWGTNTYVVDSNSTICGGNVWRVNGDGTMTMITDHSSLGGEPRGLAFWNGALYVVEAATTNPDRNIRPNSGYVERVDGPGSPVQIVATGAPLGDPSTLAAGPGGAYGTDLYIGDSGESDVGGVPSAILRMDPAGNVSTFFSGPGYLLQFPTFAPAGPFGGLLYAANNAPGVREIVTIDPAGHASQFGTLPDTDPNWFITSLDAAPDGHSLYVLMRDWSNGLTVIYQVTGNVNCTDGTSAANDLIVPSGTTCHLGPTDTIGHDVLVQPGGTLIDDTATIGHDIRADRPAGIGIGTNGTVGNDIVIDGATGSVAGDNYICNTHVGHDVIVENTAATAGFWDIGDAPECTRGGVTVGHDLIARDNAVFVDVSLNGTHPLGDQAGGIGHDLVATGNASQTVAGNAVGGNATCRPIQTPLTANQVAGIDDGCDGLAPPALTSPADDALSAHASITVTGTGVAGATAHVLVDGVAAADAFVQADGTFSVTVAVADGTHALSATQELGGVVSAASAARNVTVDTLPPIVSCGAADAAWHYDNVSIACTAVDTGSGLANAADGTFALTTSVNSGDEAANASTGSRQVCDAAGNCAAAGPIGGNKVDRKAPSVSCGSADGVWHNDNVTIACTASDGGSGVTPTSFGLSTNVPANTASTNASTNSMSVCDAVGNCVTAGPIAGNEIDRASPVLHLPADITTTNPVVTYTATATDDDDPAPVVTCTPASGSTFPAGTTTVACSATDHADNVTTGSFTVTVTGSTKTPLERLTEDANAIGNANIKAHVRNLSQVGGNGYCSQLKVLAGELAAVGPQTATTADALDAVASLQRAAGCSR